MEQGLVIEIATRAMLIIMYISGPILLLGLLVGLAISIFQATTQVQEQTLTFVPKLVAMLGSLIIFGPWMLTTLREFTLNLFQNINNYIK